MKIISMFLFAATWSVGAFGTQYGLTEFKSGHDQFLNMDAAHGEKTFQYIVSSAGPTGARLEVRITNPLSDFSS